MPISKAILVIVLLLSIISPIPKVLWETLAPIIKGEPSSWSLDRIFRTLKLGWDSISFIKGEGLI